MKLARFHFLFGGFILFMFGVLLALSNGAEITAGRFILGYAIMFCAQLSVSYSNDYYDSVTDKNGRQTLFSGGSGILLKRPELRPLAKKIAVGLILVSLALASVFLLWFSYPLSFFMFVIIGNLLGWYYTAPPAQLAYRGYGEISTMITAGLLMPGMGYFVTMGTVDPYFLLFSIPVLLYGLVFIINVEIPDMESDRAGKKYNLVVKKGRPFAFKLTGVLLIAASSYFIILHISSLITEIDLRGVIFLTFIPLLLGINSLRIGTFNRDISTKLATNNVAALFSMVMLVDIYLVFAA